MVKELFIIPATENRRQSIVTLLESVKLPVDDLPSSLDNFFVAVDGNQLVGIIGLEIHGDYGLLRSLAVMPSYRNQLIADKLVRQIEKQTKHLRLSAIYLLTETAEKYFSLRGFHKILREEVPEVLQQSSEFTHVCPASATVMTKTVTQ